VLDALRGAAGVSAPATSAPVGVAQPVLAGVVASVVGFASSFAIVLAGLHAVGATDAQAASGLLTLSVAMGVVAIALAVRTRMPLAIAWSTPGAALLVSSGVPDGGYAAALGAFALAGALIVLCGFWRALGRWIAAIPGPLASALLAGVLLPVCLSPARAAVQLPWLAIPVILAWAALMLVARRWAVPGALVAAAVAVAVDRPAGAHVGGDLLPALQWTTPTLNAAALLGLGVPLFIVTMASQNVAGMSVLRSFGYRPPLRPVLVTTGAASVAGAPFGAHGINLAAITAALAAGPDAHPDPRRRWIAAASGGATYLVFGLAAGVAVALLGAAPPLLVEAVAGLALLGTLGGALASAMADERLREAATIVLVGSASGITALGVSAPFWGLLAGLAFLGAQALRRPRG
jgi:benzoate membrane transport protein